MPRNGSGGLARGLFPHLAGANRGVLALSAARLGDAVGNSILFIVIPLYVARLPAPRLPFPETIRAGVLISAFGMVAAGAQPLAAFLSDRSDRRKPLIIAGLLLMAPATILLGQVHTTEKLAGLRIVQGIASAGIAVPAFALAADASEAGRTGRQMSLTTTGFTLGIATGPLLAGVRAVPAFSLPFFAVGVMLVAVAWAIHRHVPETVPCSHHGGEGTASS